MNALPDAPSPVAVLPRKPGSKRYQPRGAALPARSGTTPVSPSAGLEKQRPSLHGIPGRGGSVSSLPPYEALFKGGSPGILLESELEEHQSQQQQPAPAPAPHHRPSSPSLAADPSLADSIGSLNDTELELDDTVLLDRLVLRSSVALATAQSLLAGTLSVRGAILDLNSREAEGEVGLERIETESRFRLRRDTEHADSLAPLFDSVSCLLDGLGNPLAAQPAARKSTILSKRLEVGRGSVGTLSATRVEPEWSSRRVAGSGAAVEEDDAGEADAERMPAPPARSSWQSYPLGTPSPPVASGPEAPAPSSPLATRAAHGRSSPIVVHPVASTSSPTPSRRISPSDRPSSPLKPRESKRPSLSPMLNRPTTPSRGNGGDAGSTLVDEARLSTPTNPPSALPLVDEPPPTVPPPATPDPARITRPAFAQHTRSLSSFLPSLALPSLPGATSPSTVPGLAASSDEAAATKSPSTPSTAVSSPAISRLRALGSASPSPPPPVPSTAKSWGWFASASPSTT